MFINNLPNITALGFYADKGGGKKHTKTPLSRDVLDIIKRIKYLSELTLYDFIPKFTVSELVVALQTNTVLQRVYVTGFIESEVPTDTLALFDPPHPSLIHLSLS
jgi:hypothetical protein